MAHTPACDEYNKKRMDERDEYFEKWPNACRYCDGWGGHVIYGGWFEPDDWDYCPYCLGKELCPRCSDPVDEDRCKNCGWSLTEADGTNSGCECVCEFDEEEHNNGLETSCS
jgi:hypothetical protein